MTKEVEVHLTNPVGNLEVRRLVYTKYLLSQARQFLANSVVDAHYNVAVVLSANAVELFANLLLWCVMGRDASDQKISEVLKGLKSIKSFPYGRLDKVIKARNGIYHSATLNTYNTCVEIVEIASQSLTELSRRYMGVDFERLSLAELVVDEQIRDLLQSSERALNDSRYSESIISSCHAFALLKNRIRERARIQLGHVNTDIVRQGRISWSFVAKKIEAKADMNLRAFSEHIEEQVNRKVAGLMSMVDLCLILGSAYEDFKTFEAMHPICHFTIDGEFHYSAESVAARKYSRDDAEFAMTFVLNAVLSVEPRLKPVDLRALDGTIIKTVT